MPILRSARATKLGFAFGATLLLGIASAVLFGSVAGWLADDHLRDGRLLGYGLPLLQFYFFAVLADNGFQFVSFRLAETSSHGRKPPQLAIQLVRILIYFCIGSAAISQVFHQSISAILAASGIIGLVLGFALRGLVSDLFSGIALHIDRNINIGDWIEISYRGREYYGQLKDIHWRNVVFFDRYENSLLIPNSEFACSTVINRSQPDNVSEYWTHLPLGNEHDPARVLQILELALAQLVNERVVLAHPMPYARVASIESGVFTYRLFYSLTPGRLAQADAQSAVLVAATRHLRSAGIYLYAQLPNYVNPDKLTTDRPHSQAVRLRVLAGVTLLRVLSPPELERLAEHAVVQYLSAGEILMKQGDAGDLMAVIAEGVFDIIVETPDGNRIVAALWPGECVGEMSVLTGEPRSTTIQARTPCCVFLITKPTMKDLLENNPPLVLALAQLAGRRRKQREVALLPPTPVQELKKTQTVSERIRKFFGLVE